MTIRSEKIFTDEYEKAEVVNQQVMEILAEVKLDDLLVYADTLDYNHSLRDEPPFTMYEVCGVITRCLTLHSDVCSTVDEVTIIWFECRAWLMNNRSSNENLY